MNKYESLPAVPVQNWYAAQADLLCVIAAIGGLVFPGALVGALIAGAVWTITNEPTVRRALVGGLATATAVALRTLSPGWPWSAAMTALLHPGSRTEPSPADIHSLATQLLLGPSLLLLLHAAHALRSKTVLGHVEQERKQMVKRSKALTPGWRGAPSQPQNADGWDDPPGKIRLGTDAHRHVFDLDISDLGHHTFVPGASGSGKTTTLLRLARGALANGHSVVIVDCKGVGLSGDARRLAQSFGVPITIVDPDNPATVGYDPCTGDAAHVANKLVGAFTFSGEAEIYKQVAMEVIPIIVRALQATGESVNLDNITEALSKGGLARLGRTPGAEQYRDQLERLDASGGIGAAGYVGLQHRLGALMQGKFGPLFNKRPALNWADATAEQSVTYFSLSATGTSEDVELFGRVITQDLKQLCDARLRIIDLGHDLMPVLVIYDEFAALRESRQIVDLLLQARQTRMPIVIATQYLPEEIPIRTPAMQAGVLICHRVGAEDAQAIAAEFGTHSAPKLTSQIDYESGQSEKGSVRTVEEYNIHPNQLRELGVGMAAVYARRTNRRTIVHIHADNT